MPMWGGSWGGPWSGLGWIFPLIGLLFMVVIVITVIRMAGGQNGLTSGEIEELRREVRELKEEIRKLRERS